MSQGFDGYLLLENGDSSGVGTQTFDGSSNILPFDSESMGRTYSINDNHGIRGVRSRHYNRVTEGNTPVGGTVTMRPGRAELDVLLPHILGTAESTDEFEIADTLLPFSIAINRIGAVFDYRDSVVSRAVFSASSGNPLTLALDIVSKTENVISAPTVPTYDPSADNRPIEMSEGVLTLASSSREFEDFELTIDNAVQPQFRNSQTAVLLEPSDRVVTLRATLSYDATMHTAIYGKGKTGLAGQIVFTASDNMATTVTFGHLVAIDDKPPVIGGKSDVRYPITFQAYATDDQASTDENEVHFTNDSDSSS